MLEAFPKPDREVRRHERSLVFRNNETLVQQRKLSIEPNSSIFALVDLDAQPQGVNRCEEHKCDHICLLLANDSICTCNSGYELMDDGQTCVSVRKMKYKEAKTVNEDQLQSSSSHTIGIVAIVVSLGGVAALCVPLFSRNEL